MRSMENGLVVFVCLVAFVLACAICGSCGDDTAPAPRREPDREARKKTQQENLLPEHETDARTLCRLMVKAYAVYDHKWGISGTGRADIITVDGKPHIRLTGQNLDIQNEYGAWIRDTKHLCVYDPETESIERLMIGGFDLLP